jgi:hypothetical protein
MLLKKRLERQRWLPRSEAVVLIWRTEARFVEPADEDDAPMSFSQ